MQIIGPSFDQLGLLMRRYLPSLWPGRRPAPHLTRPLAHPPICAAALQAECRQRMERGFLVDAAAKAATYVTYVPARSTERGRIQSLPVSLSPSSARKIIMRNTEFTYFSEITEELINYPMAPLNPDETIDWPCTLNGELARASFLSPPTPLLSPPWLWAAVAISSRLCGDGRGRAGERAARTRRAAQSSTENERTSENDDDDDDEDCDQ